MVSPNNPNDPDDSIYNQNRKRHNPNINIGPNKRQSTYIYYTDEYYDEDETVDAHINNTPKEFVKIDRQINSLNDLIELGKMYDETKEYNIDLKILNNLVEPLQELNNIIGMDSVKEDMLDHILFKIQNFDAKNQDMMHTVIMGPPGVGKTEVAKIIAKVYLAMGILKNDKFVKATRSTLIAGYLGQTAKATQRIIDSAQGGVLFIDEVYALGNAEKRDSFSKECIDTINEALTEKKCDFICIVAGYKNDIESCFFAFNSGLERRFPIRFTIEPYTPEQLFEIFKKKVTDAGWNVAADIKVGFFVKKYKSFKFFGGDMEVLFSKCKRAHSRRVFTSEISEKKVLTKADLIKGYHTFITHKK